jgi:hypothetical protein
MTPDDVGAAPCGFQGADFDFSVAPKKIVRHPLKRFYVRRDLHFIPFRCYRRLPYLGKACAQRLQVHSLKTKRRRNSEAAGSQVT